MEANIADAPSTGCAIGMAAVASMGGDGSLWHLSTCLLPGGWLWHWTYIPSPAVGLSWVCSWMYGWDGGLHSCVPWYRIEYQLIPPAAGTWHAPDYNKVDAVIYGSAPRGNVRLVGRNCSHDVLPRLSTCFSPMPICISSMHAGVQVNNSADPPGGPRASRDGDSGTTDVRGVDSRSVSSNGGDDTGAWSGTDDDNIGEAGDNGDGSVSTASGAAADPAAVVGAAPTTRTRRTYTPPGAERLAVRRA